jgi:hypothetical protein
MDPQTSIATILEFPIERTRAPWVPPHTRQCTVDDVEFYSLRLLQHLCNVTFRPLTLWPSDRYGPRWAGREAWITHGDRRTRERPAKAAKRSAALLNLLPRHYQLGTIRHAPGRLLFSRRGLGQVEHDSVDLPEMPSVRAISCRSTPREVQTEHSHARSEHEIAQCVLVSTA